MKAPKNYYNVVDQKKLGLDQIDKNAAAIAELQDLPILPTPGEGDVGKVPIVNSEGSYELTIPDITLSPLGMVKTTPSGKLSASNYNGLNIVFDASTGSVSTRQLYGNVITISQQTSIVADNSSVFTRLSDGTNMYYGFTIGTTPNLKAIVWHKTTFKKYLANITNTVSIKDLDDVKYLDVTISGSDVTFPTGYDQAAIKALLDAGADVKLKDDNFRLYEVSYNKTNAVDFVNTDVRSSTVILNHINLLSSDNLTGTFNSGTITFDA